MENKDKSDFNLWMPSFILYDKNLKLQEKIILSTVIALHLNKGCFARNKFFAELLNLTNDRISQIISILIKKQYIVGIIHSSDGNKRLLKPHQRLYENISIAYRINWDTLSENIGIGIPKNSDHYNKINKNYITNIYNGKNKKFFDKKRFETPKASDYTKGF